MTSEHVFHHASGSESSTHKPRYKSVTQWIWGVTALVGMAVFVHAAVNTQRMMMCKGWPVVEGEILESDLEHGLMREGALKYQLKVVYGFTVGGEAYKANHISFTGTPKGHAGIQSVLAAYPKGAKVTVHYAPSNPDVATLETDFTWKAFRPLIAGMLLSCMGLAGVWRRWSMQTDYLFKERDPDQPVSKWKIAVGFFGTTAFLGLFWLWWELIKMYAGR